MKKNTLKIQKKLGAVASEGDADLLHAILESSPNIIEFALDREYRYLAFNHKHEDVMSAIWGKQINQGDNMLECITLENDRFKAKALFDRALAGESFVDETEYGNEEFSRKYWQTFYAPIYDKNRFIIGLTCFNLDISERKNAELILSKTLSQMTDLLNTLPDMVWMKDLNGVYIAANPAMEKFFGLSKESIIGKTDYDFMDVQSADTCRQTDAQALAKNAMIVAEEEVIDANGQKTVIEIRKVPIKEHDNVIGFIGIGTDITIQRKLQDALLHEKLFLKTLIHTIPDLVWVKDIEGVYLACNKRFEEFFGVPESELIGKTDYDFVDKTLADFFREHDKIAIANDHPSINEEWITFSSDGHRELLETTKIPLKNKEGDVYGILGIGHDITERKTRELQLELAELSLNAITDALYLIDEDSKIVYVNKTACETLGYTHEELIGKTPFDIDPLIVPEQMNSIRETAFTEGLIQFNTKHMRKDGSLLDVEIRTYPYVKDNKRYKLSIVKDITEQKKTEEKVKLLASIFTHTKEGIAITDTQGIIIDVNEAYSEITGYMKEEALGQNAGFIKSGRHDEEFYKNLWNKLLNDKNWRGEIRNRRKSGEEFIERLTISAISDTSGNVSNYVGLMSDVTTMKEHEAGLEKMAYYDVLTGLPNRALLMEKINNAMAISKRYGKVMAICYLDLDSFKPINDEYGHKIGDEVLIEISHRIQKSIRESDAVMRIGGDEFVLLLQDVKNKKACEKIINKILQRIDAPLLLSNHKQVKVTASIGITLFPDDDGGVESLLKNADKAMYSAKQNGKNRYSFHS